MAYSIHIERHGEEGRREPINRAEWIAAVKSTDQLRLADSELTAQNPTTGDLVTVMQDGGSAELFYEEQSAWFPVFRWSKHGIISFNATPEFDELESRLRITAVRLARKLGARLVGDEGELYP